MTIKSPIQDLSAYITQHQSFIVNPDLSKGSITLEDFSLQDALKVYNDLQGTSITEQQYNEVNVFQRNLGAAFYHSTRGASIDHFANNTGLEEITFEHSIAGANDYYAKYVRQRINPNPSGGDPVTTYAAGHMRINTILPGFNGLKSELNALALERINPG